MAINKTYRLDQKIVIQVRTGSQQTGGSVTYTWATLATVWANVVYKGGGEPYESDQKVGTSNIVFTIRYLSTVSQINRITWGGDTYDILSIDGNQRTRYLNLLTQKKDNE